MKHLMHILCSISLLYSFSLLASSGTVVTVDFTSANLSDSYYPPLAGNPRKLAIYLPPNYVATDTATRYSCLYILHQWAGDYTELASQYQPILDELITTTTGGITPIIAVMPDISYYPYLFGFYTDFTIDSHPMNFETYIIDDVVPYIDANYNTDTSSVKKRGISGYEWGGYGAIKLGTKHSDLFGSFSSFLGELNMQQILDAIFGFMLLQIPSLQVNTYITDAQRLLFSPFNQNICNQPYFTNLIWMFGASAAWSPLPIDPANPGYIPPQDPLLLNQNFYPLIFGQTAPTSNVSVNLPYDTNLNFISTVTTFWDLQRVYELVPTYSTTLATQDIWLGSTSATIDPFTGAFVFINQPSTETYSNLLTDYNITHTYQTFFGFIWVPSPSYLGFIPPSVYSDQIKEQIKFQDDVFNP